MRAPSSRWAKRAFRGLSSASLVGRALVPQPLGPTGETTARPRSGGDTERYWAV